MSTPRIMTRARGQSHPHRHHHRNITSPANNGLESNQDGDKYVQDWLNKLHEAYKNPAGEPPVLGHEQARLWDDATDLESGWCPNNLPIAPLNIHQQSWQRRKRNQFLDDDTLLTSPTTSLARGGSSPRSNHRFELISRTDGPMGDRYSPSTFVQGSTSHEYMFQKQPRKRTRPDKYQTAGQRSRARQTNPESTTSQKRPRSSRKKRRLMSKRDILNNFTSSAFCNKRLTMPPELTAGLFLNGRSSKMSNKLTDLAFNDMSFLKVQNNVSTQKELRAAAESRDDSYDDSSKEKDPILCLPSLQTQTARPNEISPSIVLIPSPGLITKQAPYRPDENPKQNVSSRIVQKRQQIPHSQRNTRAINPSGDVASQECDKNSHYPQKQTDLGRDLDAATISETPISIMQALVDTGIYSGTGIPLATLGAKHTNPEQWGKRTGEDALTRSPNTRVPSGASPYEDKRTMVTPRIYPEKDSEQQQTMGPCNEDRSDTADLEKSVSQSHGSPIPQINPIELLYRGVGFDLETDDCTLDRGFSRHSGMQYRFQNYEQQLDFHRAQDQIRHSSSTSYPQKLERNEFAEHSRHRKFRSGSLKIKQFQTQNSLGLERHSVGEELQDYNDNDPAHNAYSKYIIDDHPPRKYIGSHESIDAGPGLQVLLNQGQGKQLSPEVPYYYKAESQPHNEGNESMTDFIARIEAEVLSRNYDDEFLQTNIDMDEMRRHEDRCEMKRSDKGLEMAAFWRPNWFI